MVLQDLDYIFITLDIECKGYIEWIELQEFDEDIYHEALDIEQLEAAIETVCGPNSNGKCHKEYFSDIAKELERRHVMEDRIKWDFRALDLENVGRLSLETTLFLFKAIHNDRFSNKYWEAFIAKRRNPEADVCLDEIKLYLCNIPEYDVTDSDEEYIKCEEIVKSKSDIKHYNEFKQLQSLQETEEYLAALEKERVIQATKIKNNADNLLNRMDEIGLHALLEDDFGDGQTYQGRPKDKVTATELMDALRDKYNILRDELLLQMLRNHIGEGMWHALSSHEQQEKLFQLKIKEEKLRKEGKLETMAIHLPGSRTSVNYNVFSLMGESIPELEQRISDQQEKVRESGLPIEEVVREFGKKLNDKEKLNASAKVLLLDINDRYLFERDTLTKKLQGLGGFRTITASDREKIMFSFVQAILRGMQERTFVSCALCVGLSERVKPRNHDRSAKDPDKNLKLSSYRFQSFKDRRSLDGPVLPPILYSLKSKLGRVDLILQLLQECEHRFSLEREVLLNMMNSKQVLQHRVSVRKLAKSECKKQLSVLYAQWQGWRNKPSSEKLILCTQTKNCLEEAVALKFESVKDEMKDEPSSVISDHDAGVSILSSLQMKQDSRCHTFLNANAMDKPELEQFWREQKTAIAEEWNDNIAAVIFDIVEISKEETELLDALQNKYDTLKDKLLMQSLMDQYGKSEWDKLSEKERQKHLMQLKLQEKKLRREGKYDEIAKLLGDSALNSELLNKQLGENRENYMNQLNERLRNRQRRIDSGEDPDTIEDELLEEAPSKLTGNILKDLDQRYDDEKDALMKRLREGDDRESIERDRQAELTRLRLEARKAGREANFDSAALVLGLAERNKAALEDRLKNDRERQEQLAKQRLEARRQKRDIPAEEEYLDRIEPQKDDIAGWIDLALKELARTHEKEYNLFSDMLQDRESEDLRQEAREMSADGRQEQLNQLREKRNNLDFGAKTDQEQHMSIMEMAVAIKYVVWNENLKVTQDDGVDSDKVIISSMANLQEMQDEETRNALDLLPSMSQEELVNFHNNQLQAQNEIHLNTVSQLVFKYEGVAADDDQIVKALDNKYDTLLGKLALEALEKQLGEAEWKNLSEKERQIRAMKLKLKQKQLMKEGRLDEAAKLLGEGFECDANLKMLMGESRKKYDELLKERLENRKKRIANGEELPEMEDELTLPEDSADNELIERKTAKSLLENLQERYDDEKEALLARLQGADKKFMNEQERQAELTRLKREQRKAQKEGRFDTAAMMLGLAERNKADADAKLTNDRARHELIAKERLEKLRSKRASKVGEKDEGSVEEEAEEIEGEPDIHNALMKLIERRQMLEQEELVQYLQTVDQGILVQASLMTRDGRNAELSSLKAAVKHSDDFRNVISEMAAFKMVNRTEALQSVDQDKVISDDDLIISLMADLQEKQNKEDDEMIKTLKSAPPDEISALQKQELEYISSKMFPQVINVLGSHDEVKSADTDALVGALDTKYDALKDKLILDALEKQVGIAEWTNMNEKERQQELLKIKLEQKRLKQEGKIDEASRIMNELLQNDTNVQSLLGLSKAEQEKRLSDRLSKRRLLKNSGMTDEEIKLKEDKEDEALEVEIAKTSTGNVLQDLEKNYEAEKDALINSLKNADSKLANERQRQLELARLRREAKKIKTEEKFDTAAMVLGMAKSQHAALELQMESDRSRQEKLAKERLQARRNKRLSAQKKKDETLQQQMDETINEDESNDPITLQGNILNAMETIHEIERNLLMELTQEEDIDSHKKASSLSSEQRQKRLFVLKELRKNWRESLENPGEQTDMFREAMHLKLEELKSESDMKDEDVFVKLLANLQDFQDLEAESTMKDLAEKNIETLKQLFQIKQTALTKQCYDNIAFVVLDTSKLVSNVEGNSVEDELSNALKEKYDALKEKVYEEALKGKFDKDTWDAMTTKEKEGHIANMKANDQLNTHEEDTVNNLDAVMLPSMNNLIDDGGTKISNVKKGTDILKDLESQFEAEKDALLASLRDVDTKEINERERQLALALLRRDKMRIKREEKYDGAALLFNTAKQNEAEKGKSYQNERSRQEQLAKERIAARRKNKKDKLENQALEVTKNEFEQMKEEEDKYKEEDLKTVEKLEREGTIALQESVLNEMEEKHYAEQDKLYEMVQLTTSDKLIEVSKLEPDEQNTKLSLMSISRNKLRNQCKAFVDSEVPESMSEDEKRIFEKSLTKERSTQSQIIHDGLVIALVIKSSNLGKPMEGGNLDEEVMIGMMADLQEIQSMESNALTSTLNDCDKEMVETLKKELRKSRRAGYLDNLATIVFRECTKKTSKEDKAADVEEMKKEDEKIEAEAAEQLVELEKELEDKRKALPTMSGDDMEKYMRELERQEEAKRRAINEQISKQRDLAKQRLLAKQKKRDEKIQESEFVNAMIVNAHKTTELMREKTMAVQGAQKDTLAERLQRRREDRKRKQQEAEEKAQLAQVAEEQLENKRKQEKAEETKTPDEDVTPIPKTEPEVKKKKAMPPLPGGGMKREKTVVEKAAVIPENKKQEMINMLMREQTSLAMKISSEQSRQEEQVRNLREKRRKKMQARESEAAAVLGLGQRQKTMVEERQKGERERQIGQIRERVERIKQERNSARSNRGSLSDEPIMEDEQGEDGENEENDATGT